MLRVLEELIVSKEVRDIRAAEWEGFKRLAKHLPNHQVLGVNLIRTRNNLTAAVFTVVRNGEPVQMVVLGDARGQLLPNQDFPRRADGSACSHEHVLFALQSDVTGDGSGGSTDPATTAGLPSSGDPGDTMPDAMAIGQPPVKGPVQPGVVGLAGPLLSAAFGTSQFVDLGSNT